jgi:hypothetical protein
MMEMNWIVVVNCTTVAHSGSICVTAEQKKKQIFEQFGMYSVRQGR